MRSFVLLLIGLICMIGLVGCIDKCHEGATRCSNTGNVEVCLGVEGWSLVTDCGSIMDFKGKMIPMRCQEMEDAIGSVHACVPFEQRGE